MAFIRSYARRVTGAIVKRGQLITFPFTGGAAGGGQTGINLGQLAVYMNSEAWVTSYHVGWLDIRDNGDHYILTQAQADNCDLDHLNPPAMRSDAHNGIQLQGGCQ